MKSASRRSGLGYVVDTKADVCKYIAGVVWTDAPVAILGTKYDALPVINSVEYRLWYFQKCGARRYQLEKLHSRVFMTWISMWTTSQRHKDQMQRRSPICSHEHTEHPYAVSP